MMVLAKRQSMWLKQLVIVRRLVVSCVKPIIFFCFLFFKFNFDFMFIKNQLMIMICLVIAVAVVVCVVCLLPYGSPVSLFLTQFPALFKLRDHPLAKKTFDRLFVCRRTRSVSYFTLSFSLLCFCLGCFSP